MRTPRSVITSIAGAGVSEGGHISSEMHLFFTGFNLGVSSGKLKLGKTQ